MANHGCQLDWIGKGLEDKTHFCAQTKLKGKKKGKTSDTGTLCFLAAMV